MKTKIPAGYMAVFNRLALCVLEDLSRCFDNSDPNYESLLAAFDHQFDPQRLPVEDSLRVIQSIEPDNFLQLIGGSRYTADHFSKGLYAQYKRLELFWPVKSAVGMMDNEPPYTRSVCTVG